MGRHGVVIRILPANIQLNTMQYFANILCKNVIALNCGLKECNPSLLSFALSIFATMSVCDDVT